jgi:hypothetical protein
LVAGTIELEWTSVSGAQGYRVHYGTTPGVYGQTLDVGPSPRATLRGLTDCTTWYVAVTAFNHHGESGLSSEVSGWPRPEVGSVEPSVTQQGSRFTLNVHGSNFAPGAHLLLRSGTIPVDIAGHPLVRVESSRVVSCRQVEASIAVEALARGSRAMEVGTFSVVYEVRNPDETFGVGSRSFEVLFDSSRWDINRSDSETRDRIDGADLSWLSFSYGSNEGDPFYDPDADLNGDGMVDGEDLAFLATGFGLCWSGSDWSVDACD